MYPPDLKAFMERTEAVTSGSRSPGEGMDAKLEEKNKASKVWHKGAPLAAAWVRVFRNLDVLEKRCRYQWLWNSAKPLRATSAHQRGKADYAKGEDQYGGVTGTQDGVTVTQEGVFGTQDGVTGTQEGGVGNDPLDLTFSNLRSFNSDLANSVQISCRSTSMACRMLAVEDAPSQPVRRVYDAVIQGEERVEDAPNFRTVRTQLEHEWARTLGGRQYLSHQDNGRGILVFGTNRNFRKLRHCAVKYPTATSSPVIHGLYHGRVIPFVMALMTSKTVGAYRQVLQHIKEKEREETGHDLSPESDFEVSIISSNETEFPDAISWCYFHFCQSLWWRIQQLSLAGPCRWDPRLKRCLRKVMGIGYLPVALVRFNFQEHIGRNSTQQLIGQYPALQEFFDYKETNYVAADDVTFPIPLWNVYNRDTDTRTNNLMPYSPLYKVNDFVVVRGNANDGDDTVPWFAKVVAVNQSKRRLTLRWHVPNEEGVYTGETKGGKDLKDDSARFDDIVSTVQMSEDMTLPVEEFKKAWEALKQATE
ncbi:Hypp9607 [Branchiostoma lanceolatum]|uniref:Hypp9607 protein n=1 Tax=Branchiostoma lanceolatum TaxID=7740 RepID=A0A8S4MNF1_BRALA|nr:Hypp9607 [Branchiostoma lanceolatum]